MDKYRNWSTVDNFNSAVKGVSMYTESSSNNNDYNHRQIDVLFNSRIRFASMAYLLDVSEASFVEIRDQINTTDGNLLVHLRKLESAGYIECIKCLLDRKLVTLYRVTRKGRVAFYQHYLCMQKFCQANTGFENSMLVNMKIAMLT